MMVKITPAVIDVCLSDFILSPGSLAQNIGTFIPSPPTENIVFEYWVFLRDKLSGF